MGKTYRQAPPLDRQAAKQEKPRAAKKRRQLAASAPEPKPELLEFPEPEAPRFKPMG